MGRISGTLTLALVPSHLLHENIVAVAIAVMLVGTGAPPILLRVRLPGNTLVGSESEPLKQFLVTMATQGCCLLVTPPLV